jgi:hypothetical protein
VLGFVLAFWALYAFEPQPSSGDAPRAPRPDPLDAR